MKNNINKEQSRFYFVDFIAEPGMCGRDKAYTMEEIKSIILEKICLFKNKKTKYSYRIKVEDISK